MGLIESEAFNDGGADTIRSGGGDDIVLGGDGGDQIEAGRGSNVVLGDNGRIDFTRAERTGLGTKGADLDAEDIDLIESLSLTEGGGRDTITTLDGDDVVLGGRFADTIRDSGGRNIVLGDSGQITASDSHQATPWFRNRFRVTRIEALFDDVPDAGDDITTGAGEDLILGGLGSDHISAGAGDDLVFGDRATVWARNDGLLDVSRFSLRSGGPIQITLLKERRPFNLYGDVILAGDGKDTVFGQQGNDVLRGEGGNDALLGGSGHDSLHGGRGNDVLFGQGGRDAIDGDQGDDLIYGGEGADLLRGGSGSDQLIGNDGDDQLDGGPGADILWGDHGKDRLVGGSGAGQDSADGGAGRDTYRGIGRIFGQDLKRGKVPRRQQRRAPESLSHRRRVLDEQWLRRLLRF